MKKKPVHSGGWRAPSRAVTGSVERDGQVFDVLECGHEAARQSLNRESATRRCPRCPPSLGVLHTDEFMERRRAQERARKKQRRVS